MALPTAEEAFGVKLPTPEEAFGPSNPQNVTNAIALAGPEAALSGADMDEYFSRGPVAEVLNHFGQGAKQGWGTQPLGFSPETEAALRKAGVFNDYETGRTSILRGVNEQLFRPIAAALDALGRAPYAAARGILEVAPPVGAPLVAGLEAFPAGHLTGFPANVPPPQMYARAADLGVIGKGEAGYRDFATDQAIEALTPGEPAPRPLRASASGTATGEFSPTIEASATLPPLDVHGLAREIAPDTFAEYDALSARRDTFRRWLDELAESRANSEQAQQLQGRIDDILGKVGGVEDRLTKAAARRLQDARDQLDSFLRTDTPDMARVRQDLQKTDFARRDLAPDVSAAYRQAAERLPSTEEPAATAITETPAPPETPREAATAPETPAATPAAPEGEPTAAASPQPAAVAPEPQPALPGTEAPKPPAPPLEGGITGDISRQLVAAGRPAEEAQAAAALVQAHYEARAERFGGTKGSAEDLYRADAPSVRAGRGVTATAAEPVMEPAQAGATRRGKIRLATENARATITLMRDADSSTFIHETGHHWLEELMADARDPAAPADLAADAATVRQWLGVEQGVDIPRRAHEKFARGFERYMMEGHAPSRALVDVFAKFRDWLTRIYETVTRLRSPINDDIRGVYDRLLSTGKEAEPVIAPERAEPPSAPREFGPTAAPKSATASVYEKVPIEPRRLADFLRREGGVQEQGGEISHIIGGKNQRPGLINGKGLSLDDAALRAWEEGYFPDHGENRPTINDLLDAIREDVSGNAQYSHKDRAMVEAYRGAMDRNAEIDRLADTMGVNPREMTREQFFDLAAEHLSRAEQARTIGEQDAASERAFAEAEAHEKQVIEDRGDAWEPDAVYGISEPRTLEDLENAYRSEAAATRAPGEGLGGAVEPGRVAGGAGSVQEGAGSRGSGAGPAGRAGSGASETPAGANATFGPADTGLVDKAGNIRIDNLRIPEDVAEAIRDAAEQNAGFIEARRGVLSDGEVLSLADALGMDAAKLNQRKLGQAFNAEEVVAARKLLIRSATEVRDAMARAANGSEADVLAYAQAKARHLMIQEQVSGITAEAGRALRAFRALEGSRDVEALREFFQQQTGRTLDQMRREAQLGLNLDTPQQVSRFVQDSEKPTWKDYLVEAWINALLSGPKTHIKNIIGNAAVAVNSVAETGIAALIGEARQRLIPGAAAERVQFKEIEARLFGLMQGAQDGLIAAGKAIRDEDYVPVGSRQVEQRRYQAIPSVKVNVAGIEMELGGKQVRLPSRMLMAEDEFFKSVAARQELNAIAYRVAMDEGLTGDAFTARVADLVQNPSEAMVEQSRRFAEYQTFTNSLGRAGSAIQTFANAHLPLKLVFPFIRTPLNLLKYANERTPLGLFSKEVRANLSGANGAVARDTQLARMALGTAVATSVVGLVLNNFVTGGGPSDPSQKAALRLTGWRPYAVRVGDMYYDYNWLDPISTVLGVTSDLVDAVRSGVADDAEVDKIAGALIASISKNILSKASLRGASDLVQALTDPDRYGPKYLQNLAGTLVPSVIAQPAAAEDPLIRDARTMLDAIKARIPGLRETVLPKRDLWGEPLPNQGALGPDLLSPVLQSHINSDPVNRALVDLKFAPAPVEHKIRGVELTPQQFDDYARIGGRLAKMQLDAIVGPGFNGLPPEVRRKVISETVSHAREVAATQVMMQSVGSANDIMQKAMDAKASGLQGASHEHVRQMMKAH
jgi:hypothetical protein